MEQLKTPDHVMHLTDGMPASNTTTEHIYTWLENIPSRPDPPEPIPPSGSSTWSMSVQVSISPLSLEPLSLGRPARQNTDRKCPIMVEKLRKYNYEVYKCANTHRCSILVFRQLYENMRNLNYWLAQMDTLARSYLVHNGRRLDIDAPGVVLLSETIDEAYDKTLLSAGQFYKNLLKWYVAVKAVKTAALEIWSSHRQGSPITWELWAESVKEVRFASMRKKHLYNEANGIAWSVNTVLHAMNDIRVNISTANFMPHEIDWVGLHLELDSEFDLWDRRNSQLL